LSIIAELLTPPVVPPLPNCSIPALIVVVPDKLLFAVNTNVPTPDWTKLPGPLITPLKVTVSLRSKAKVPLSVTFPEPVREPMVLELPFRSTVPRTLKLEFELRAVADAAWRTPEETIVAPI